jgi:hypothetical protein
MDPRAVVVPFRTSRSRRRIAAARLAAVRPTETVGSEQEWAARLRHAAEDLGPVFVSFCDYLSTRLDLLPAGASVALGQAFNSPPCWPAAAVARRIAAELEHATSLRDLSARAVVSTPYSQTHEARLPAGERVHVEVVTLDDEAAAADLELVPLIGGVCRSFISEAVFASAVSDFHAWFAERRDCRRRLPLALAATARAVPGAPIVVAAPRPEFCSAHVLVSALPAEPVDLPGEEDDVPWQRASDPALDVVSAWLRQAISGDVVPVLAPGSVIVPGRPVVTCDGFARFTARTRQHLTAYLLALGSDLPDRAWDALAHELLPVAGAAPREEVARAFRCLVPFRDDRTCNSGSEVADRAFLQWRTATKHGWIPTADIAAFYRGLATVIAAVREVASGRDLLAEAVHGLRLATTLRQFDEWSQGLDLTGAVERQVTLLMQLPQKLDRLLTVAAEGSVRVQLVSDERRAARRVRATALVALLMVASAVAVLAGSIGSWPHAWSDSTQATALVLTGGLLVWAAGRVL